MFQYNLTCNEERAGGEAVAPLSSLSSLLSLPRSCGGGLCSGGGRLTPTEEGGRGAGLSSGVHCTTLPYTAGHRPALPYLIHSTYQQRQAAQCVAMSISHNILV